MSRRYRLSRITPAHCHTNCDTIWISTSQLTICPSEKKQNGTALSPIVTSDTCGKCFVGWTRANARKNCPSRAAEDQPVERRHRHEEDQRRHDERGRMSARGIGERALDQQRRDRAAVLRL